MLRGRYFAGPRGKSRAAFGRRRLPKNDLVHAGLILGAEDVGYPGICVAAWVAVKKIEGSVSGGMIVL
jgi:hypothetical protein